MNDNNNKIRKPNRNRKKQQLRQHYSTKHKNKVRYKDIHITVTFKYEDEAPQSIEQQLEYLHQLQEDGKCVLCEQSLKLAPTNKEHWIPRSLGGPSTPDNVFLAHQVCNTLKGNMTPGIWLEHRKEIYDRALKYSKLSNLARNLIMYILANQKWNQK